MRRRTSEGASSLIHWVAALRNGLPDVGWTATMHRTALGRDGDGGTWPLITGRRGFCTTAATQCHLHTQQQQNNMSTAGRAEAAEGSDPLEISEVLGATTTTTTTTARRVMRPPQNSSSGSAAENDDSDDAATDGAFETVHVLDVFARAKILNFINRCAAPGSGDGGGGASASAPTSTAAPIFEVRRVHTFDGSYEFMAKIRLPILPVDVYGVRFGEGCAPTEKDAEVVAAMHAERVIDALGFPLFLLASKQQRHAEAAIKAGRWAIMPGAASERPPPSTPSPPPLQLIVADAKQVVDEQLHDDERRYTSVTDGSVSPLRHTLASSLYLDKQSIARMRQFLDAHGLYLQRCMRCIPLHSLQKRESARRVLKHTTDTSRAFRRGEDGDQGGCSSSVAPPQEHWLVQIRLPISDLFGVRVASGRAQDKKTAVACACMHAELMLDALGVALYPSNPSLQAQHAQECQMVGRWATDVVNGTQAKHSEIAPPPLRYVANLKLADIHAPSASLEYDGSARRTDVPQDASSAMGRGVFEQTLREHASAIQALAHVTRLTFVDADAKSDVLVYLARVQQHDAPPTSPFLTQTFGVKGRETFRSTLTVPLPMPIEVALAPLPGPTTPDADASSVSTTTTAMQTAAVFQRNPSATQRIERVVAIGIGPSTETSEQCCAMHALLMLGSLGIPIYTNDEAQDMYAARVTALGGVAPRAAAQLTTKALVPLTWRRCVEHCAMKYVGDGTVLLGRVGHSGLLTADDAGNITTGHDAVRLKTKCLRAREALSKSSWSTDPDSEDPFPSIVLHPTASSDKHCTRYGHTLGNVRIVDSTALLRAQDYFERHGLELSKCWIVVAPTPPSTPATPAASAALDGASSSDAMFAVHVKVPVPVHFGQQQATGMATTREEAEVLCAMHVELLLDALGIPMYDYVALQVRHAELAASLGRLVVPPNIAQRDETANGPGKVVLSGRPVVPPLVKPSATSLMWLKHVRRVHGCDVQVEKAMGDPYINKDMAPTSTGTEGAESTDSTTNIANPDVVLLASMTAVAEGSIVPALKKYLEQYFSRCECVLDHEVQLSQRVGPTGHLLYHAVLPMPVPERFGRRVARSVASSKRNAVMLCAMHGVSILDTLGIPLFLNWAKQSTHADYQQARGIKAPRSQAECAGIPVHVPTPPGLKCIEAGADVGLDGRVSSAASMPVRPLAEEMVRNPVAWSFYVKQCRSYLEAKHEAEVYKALIVDRRTPRSGVAVEDEGLDAVEQLRFEHAAKGALRSVCTSLGFPPPDHFHVEGYGRSPLRSFVASHAVLGTIYTATGSGPDHFNALGRAAMHYIWILRRIVAGQPTLQRDAGRPLVAASAGADAQQPSSSDGRRISNRNAATSREDAVAERIRRTEDDDVGQSQVLATLKVFAAIHPPAQPLSYAMRERPHPSGSVVYSCTAEVDDDCGLRITAKGESTVDAQAAKMKAMAALHRLLGQRASMQALAHRMRPGFRADALTVLEFPSRPLRERLQALRAAHPDTDTTPLAERCSAAKIPSQWRVELEHLFTLLPRDGPTGLLRAYVLGEALPLQVHGAEVLHSALLCLGLATMAPHQQALALTPLGIEVQWLLAMLLATLCTECCAFPPPLKEADIRITMQQQREQRRQWLDGLARRGSVCYHELLLRSATCVGLSAKLGCLDAGLIVASHVLCGTDTREAHELLATIATIHAAKTAPGAGGRAAGGAALAGAEGSSFAMRRLWVHQMADRTTHSPFAVFASDVATRPSFGGALSNHASSHPVVVQLMVAASFATPHTVGVASSTRVGCVDFLSASTDLPSWRSVGNADDPHPLIVGSAPVVLGSLGSDAAGRFPKEQQQDALGRARRAANSYYCAVSRCLGERCVMQLDAPWVLFFACGGAPAPADLGGRDRHHDDDDTAAASSDPQRTTSSVTVWDDVPNLVTLWNGLLPFALHVSPQSTSRAASTPKEASPCLQGELLWLAQHLHWVLSRTPLSACGANKRQTSAIEGSAVPMTPTPVQEVLSLVLEVLALPTLRLAPVGDAPPRVMVSPTGRERFVVGALEAVAASV